MRREEKKKKTEEKIRISAYRLQVLFSRLGHARDRGRLTSPQWLLSFSSSSSDLLRFGISECSGSDQGFQIGGFRGSMMMNLRLGISSLRALNLGVLGFLMI
eukprot:TRINITY_DN39788_c1_g1_i1.p1 TRINITY_DN39788_c1_g1~~TRINITY_DN39788_c1_g1_i1.p1  ORF type:complete len:102 (-),score=16.68 TRINITY_DN39788_c1_g1_i1:131-436(-)